METALDFLSSLLDEIALEGLDGITLSMLWERLHHRPHFPLALDDDSKIFLWECIAVHKDVEIYELPEPREFVPVYNRYEHIDSELGIVVEPTEIVNDPYPVVFVKDGAVRGSCSTYTTRKCITSDIRYDDVLLLSLTQVVEKWGEALVLVASPKARLLALIGTEINPIIELSPEEYCLLERIGRSRYLGEVTQGETGLLALKANFCKQLHYNRKKLTLKGLITKQLHYMKNRKGQATTGSLFHLIRFYVQRKTKMEILMKCMCDILKDKPGQRETCKVLKQELGVKETTFKKLFYRPSSKWVNVITLTHKDYFPNATKKESFTSSGQERLVKAVQLVNHCYNADEEESDEEKETALPLNKYFDCTKVYHDIPMVSQLYNAIKEAGPAGMTASDIGRTTTLPRLDVRSNLRILVKKGRIVTVLQDRGRQKVTKYISKIFGSQNEAYTRVSEQEEKEKNINNQAEDNKTKIANSKIIEVINEENTSVSGHKNISSSLSNKRRAEESPDQNEISKNKKVRFNDNIQEIIFERYEKESAESNKRMSVEHTISAENLSENNEFSKENNVEYQTSIENNLSKENKTSKENDSLEENAVFNENEVCKENVVPVEDEISKETKFKDNILSKQNKTAFKSDKSNVMSSKNAEVFNEKLPELVSCESIAISKVYASSAQMTERKLKRLDMIIDFIKSSRLTTLTDIQKYITEKEKAEGYTFKVDKKSTKRLLYHLHINKKISIFKAVLKLEKQKVEIEFICDYSLQSTDPCVKAAIEQAKFKYFCTTKGKSKKNTPNPEQLKLTNSRNLLTAGNSDRKVFPLPTYKIIYHSHPKFLRMKSLHQYLFYLVYQYEGGVCQNDSEPFIFHNSMSWKRFIPPLPNYEKQGWCFVADIYSRMPLSVFVKIINLRHEISDVKDYLNHEEKAHYLLKHLPQNMRNSLLSNRKYLFSADDVMKGLCYMGLLSYGPQFMKQKDQVYVYVHKNASLKDTTISTPGYLHVNNELNYEVKSYTFNSLSDVEAFWLNLENVCFNTPLGKYGTFAGQTIAIAEANHKPELQESIKNKNFDEICDDGHIPGDGLGAAGFDSALFLHQRRNWQSSSNAKLCEKPRIDVSNPTMCTNTIQHLLKNKEKPCPEIRGRLQRLSKSSSYFSKIMKMQKEKATIKKDKVSPVSNFRRRKGIKYRLIKMRKHRVRLPYYDEKDKAAMEKMDKARCEWAAQEDSFLLMCKVASSFLDPSSTKLVVPYTVVRDLLHEHLPELSADKSSRACQRRMRYMMLNSSTTNNVAVFLGEARQDLELVEEFEKLKQPKTQEDRWTHNFTTVLKRLIKKFTLPTSDRCKNIDLPATLAEFHDNFQIQSPRTVFPLKSNYKNPESEEEVEHMKIYSLIVSAMAIANNDKYWSLLLHKMYEIYPESILREVVARLRGEKIIAVKKKSYRRDLQRSLLSTFPYKFSITYSNAMSTKFPIKMFRESSELFSKLNTDYSSIELKGNMSPGHTAAVLSLVFVNELSLCFEIPDQIILFNTSLSEEIRSNIVQRMIHTLSDKDSDELSRILHNDTVIEKDNICRNTSLEEAKKTNELSTKKISEIDQNKIIDNDLSQTGEFQRSTNASRFALYLLRHEMSQPPIERVQHSQDYIVLNSCRVFCKNTPSEGSKLVPLNPPEIIEKNSRCSKMIESVSINREEVMLTDERFSEILSSLLFYFPPNIFDANRDINESLKIVYEGYSALALHDAQSLFEHLYEANALGITEKDLWEAFKVLSGELDIFKHLDLLRKSSLIVRVGVSTFTYICACHAHPWILESFILAHKSSKKKLGKKKGMQEVKNLLIWKWRCLSRKKAHM